MKEVSFKVEVNSKSRKGYKRGIAVALLIAKKIKMAHNPLLSNTYYFKCTGMQLL